MVILITVIRVYMKYSTSSRVKDIIIIKISLRILRPRLGSPFASLAQTLILKKNGCFMLNTTIVNDSIPKCWQQETSATPFISLISLKEKSSLKATRVSFHHLQIKQGPFNCTNYSKWGAACIRPLRCLTGLEWIQWMCCEQLDHRGSCAMGAIC